MRRVSIVGLLVSILFCSLTRLGNSQQRQNATTGLPACKLDEITEYLPTPKTATIRNTGGALWIIVTTIAILCNALIIHVVRVNKNMRSTTNYLIVNMAVGDTFAAILTTIVALYTTYKGYGWSWGANFGEFIYCRMICPMYYLCMLCSIYSLVVITFDRFLAVKYPVKYKNRSSWTKHTIACIWLTSLAVATHYAVREISFCIIKSELYCIPIPSGVQAYLMLILGFALPHFIILTLYMIIVYTLCTRRGPGEHPQDTSGQTATEKAAKKITLMIVCILIAFDVAYVPIFLAYLFPFLLEARVSESFLEVLSYKILLITNGISNALIYAVFNKRFRQAFQEALPGFNRFKVSVGKLNERLTTNKVSPSSQDKTFVSGT